MNQLIKASTHWLAVWLLMSFFALPAHSQLKEGDPNKYTAMASDSSCRYFDGFAENGNGTITDPRNQLTWKRCPEGSSWDGATCSGVRPIVNFYQALNLAKSSRFLGKSDWRLPTVDEVNLITDQALLKPDLRKEKCNINRADQRMAFSSDIVDKKSVDIFLEAPSKGIPLSWLIAENVTCSSTAYIFEGKTGVMYQNSCDSDRPVRLVRSDTESAKSAMNLFNELYKSLAEPKFEELRKLKLLQDNEARRVAAERQNAERQLQNEERQLRDLINNKNPQTMYLAAGSYERNGDSYKAKQVYEAIISRFPSSSWAVKANDQLNDTKRSNDAESAASQRQYDAQRASREADSRSKSQCSVRISQCENTCSGMKGDSWRRCNSGCQSLCSQF